MSHLTHSFSLHYSSVVPLNWFLLEWLTAWENICQYCCHFWKIKWMLLHKMSYHWIVNLMSERHPQCIRLLVFCCLVTGFAAIVLLQIRFKTCCLLLSSLFQWYLIYHFTTFTTKLSVNILTSAIIYVRAASEIHLFEWIYGAVFDGVLVCCPSFKISEMEKTEPWRSTSFTAGM